MNSILGKNFTISGMVIKIVSEESDKWETRNVTTNETIFFKKSVLENAIKLGKAIETSLLDDEE